ncbi:MAG: glycosyltransferase family 4 protein [bacterium]
MNWQVAGALLQNATFRAASPLARGWHDFSRLILTGDQGGWVLDEEIRDLRSVCKKISVRTVAGGWAAVSRRQCVFYASQFALLNQTGGRGHRKCFAYFHGRPGSGLPEFDAVFENLRKTHDQWMRIQVSHSEMREVVLSSGIAPEKVHVIPIGIRPGMFSMCTNETRTQIRKRLGIPEDAFVAGSFQKDGCGWGEGLEPKLIKGPDVLVEVLRVLKGRIPELFVLLCGPARGYVKRGLAEAGIPFHHVFTQHYDEIPALYHALDVCMVTSRQEGGPKAVLEAMASGIPLVTTRVGQAMDLVRDAGNGFMCAVEEVEGLVHAVERVRGLSREEKHVLLRMGRATAEANAWDRQGSLWKDFFTGVVE